MNKQELAVCRIESSNNEVFHSQDFLFIFDTAFSVPRGFDFFTGVTRLSYFPQSYLFLS